MILMDGIKTDKAEVLRKVNELIEKGFSHRKIASELKINKSTIYHIMRQKPGYKSKSLTFKRYSHEEKIEIYNKYKELKATGLSDVKITKELGIAPGTLIHYRKKFAHLPSEDITPVNVEFIKAAERKPYTKKIPPTENISQVTKLEIVNNMLRFLNNEK